jgi:hypothetical protein
MRRVCLRVCQTDGNIMQKTASFLIVLLIAGSAAIAGYACAEEKPAEKKEAVVRTFVKAFFSEDKKSVIETCSGQMQSDMQKYFWIKTTVAGDKPAAPREWNGKLEILSSKREKIISTYVNLTESEEDSFEIKVDGRRFTVAVDDTLKIIMFNDATPPRAER